MKWNERAEMKTIRYELFKEAYKCFYEDCETKEYEELINTLSILFNYPEASFEQLFIGLFFNGVNPSKINDATDTEIEQFIEENI